MTSTALPQRVRPVLLAVFVAGAIGMLSGCVTSPAPVGPSDGPSATSTPSGTLPPSQQPDLGEPGPDCADVLTADDIYAYNPNMSAVAAPAPAEGTAAAEAAALDGSLCRWSNATSNLAIDVAVAVPGDDEFAALQASAESDATPVDAFGAAPDVRGYFDVDGSIGTAQVFAAGRWIVISSPMFLEATDAEPLVTAVLANLGDGS